MPKKKEVVSDFRYATGEARVPWAAVGENVRSLDVMEMVKLLVQPEKGKKTRYDAQLKKVVADLTLDKHILTEVVRKKL